MLKLRTNRKDSDATVKVTIFHQKKNKKDEWDKVDPINLNTLKANEEVRMSLSSEETLRLYRELEKLYALGAQGVKYGERDYVVARKENVVVTRENKAIVVRQLIEKGFTDSFLEELAGSQGDLIKRFTQNKILKERQQAVAEFERSINDSTKTEPYWQGFFSHNRWIFGLGLNYKILNSLSDQPNYGRMDFTGKGQQRGDFLRMSGGDKRFTVLVEIKTPNKALLENRSYRNGVYSASGEMTGGVAQVQVNARSFDYESQSNPRTREKLDGLRVSTVMPKGILVIGRLSELDDTEKMESFELFRRNIHNPEILTFDELLERARFIADQSNFETIE